MSYLNYKDSESHYSGPLPVKVNIMLLYKIPLYVGPRKMTLFNNSPSYVPPSQIIALVSHVLHWNSNSYCFKLSEVAEYFI